MELNVKKVQELIDEGVIFPPLDGNHGEKHPKTSDYVDEGIPFILVPDLVDGVVDLEHCNHITKAQASTLNKGISKTGDVLFTHKATIGKVALVDTKAYEYIVLTPQVTYYRIKDPAILDNKYLYYYFKSNYFQDTFKLFASSGGTRDYLGIVAQRKLPIIFPSISIQKNIVSILSPYDDLISNNNKRIKILEQMAENIYKEWFVRFRFPGHENAEFVDGVPKGWKVCKLKDIIKFNPKYDFKQQYSYINIPMAALSTSGMSIDKSQITIEEKSSGTHFVNGDVLFAKITPCLENGKTGLVNCLNDDEVGTGSTEFIVMHGVKVDSFFTYCIARDELFRRQAINSMNGADGRQRADLAFIKKIKWLLPSDELLVRFKRFTDSVIKQIEMFNKQNQNLIKQRDYLLPRLMSGKLQV